MGLPISYWQDFSPTCCFWWCWMLAVKQNYFLHDPHRHVFCLLFVPCSSAKCKMSLKTRCTSYTAGPSQETNLCWMSSCVRLLLQFTLFQKCLLILDSMPRTWKQISGREVLVDFFGGRDDIRSPCPGVCSEIGLESNWGSSCRNRRLQWG